MRKKGAVAYFKVLYQHVYERIQENQEKTLVRRSNICTICLLNMRYDCWTSSFHCLWWVSFRHSHVLSWRIQRDNLTVKCYEICVYEHAIIVSFNGWINIFTKLRDYSFPMVVQIHSDSYWDWLFHLQFISSVTPWKQRNKIWLFH